MVAVAESASALKTPVWPLSRGSSEKTILPEQRRLVAVTETDHSRATQVRCIISAKVKPWPTSTLPWRQTKGRLPKG